MDDKQPNLRPGAPIVVDWSRVGAAVLSLMPTGILKTGLGILLGIVAGWHYLKGEVGQMIDKAPRSIIEKIAPKKLKAADAIGKIQFGNRGCTATVMGPIEPDDDTIDILTAAHCVQLNGKGRMTLKDGRTLEVRCVSRDERSDVAWLQATRPTGELAGLMLCEVPPPPGSQVWHQGYGVDKPANVESGILRGTVAAGKKCEFVLSVSSGDSGGGIICTDDDRVISPVCCTTCLGCTGTVWGGSPAAAAAIRPRRNASTAEPPPINPVLQNPPPTWLES